jgi:hypothetical protein
MYYRNANCAVVVYDITQAASLEKARAWVRELQRQADPNIVIALCGNKADLGARRQVSQDEAQKYATEEGLMWAETSAKSGEGVAEVFTNIGRPVPCTGFPSLMMWLGMQRRSSRSTRPRLQEAAHVLVRRQQAGPRSTSTSSPTQPLGTTPASAEHPSRTCSLSRFHRVHVWIFSSSDRPLSNYAMDTYSYTRRKRLQRE